MLDSLECEPPIMTLVAFQGLEIVMVGYAGMGLSET